MFSYSRNISTLLLRCGRLPVKKFIFSDQRYLSWHHKVVPNLRYNEIIYRNYSIYFLNSQTQCHKLLTPHNCLKNQVNVPLKEDIENHKTNMNYIKFFTDPKSIVHNIFNAVSQRNHADYKPNYKFHQDVNNMFKCKMTLKWPTEIEIEQKGYSEKEAAYKACVVALMLLTENNLINNSGKPKFNKNLYTIAHKKLSAIKTYSTDLYKKYEDDYEENQELQNLSQYLKSNKDEFNNNNTSNCSVIEIDPQQVQLAAKIFKQTLNVLNCFFQKTASILNDATIVLPTFYYLDRHHFWECVYEIYWPETIQFIQSGNQRREARYNCANDILAWFLTNNYISRSGKPVIDSLLTFGSGNTFLQSSGNNQVRWYSTVNVQNENFKVAETLEAENDTETMCKQFPLPKQILNNMYDLISKDLNKPELKLRPEFKIVKQNKTNNWLCIYELKWPEIIKFTHTSKSKQDASNKAAIAALTWLQKKGKIDKHGRPKIVDKETIKQFDKHKNPLIELTEETRATMTNILEEFSIFKPHLNFSTSFDNDKVTNANSARIIKQTFIGRAKYKLEEFNKLPISAYREQIVNAIDKKQIIIIKGEPGCGKSTRVPQYILDHWANNDGPLGEPCRIAVTQPRRIAAISLAERVAKERHDYVGNIVGYQVRLKSNFNKGTGRIFYCTTGILLRQLQSDPHLLNYTHIILDEAHERDINTDLLINLLRNVLEINPRLKLIIMSATIDTQLFQDYYDEASVIHVPGFTYPVKSYYLDTCKNLDLNTTKEYCKNNNPQIAYKDVAAIITHIHKNSPEGAILCFLPGWNEIAKVQECLVDLRNANVLCLHSRLQMSEQWQIFGRSPPGVRKIILSTNIAETSVTIDDVVYVIDTGISKEKTYDAKKGVMCLDNQWVTQANINQRIGRAGRVQPGKSYHLYPKSKYNELPTFAIPEILCTSLTKVVLDSKVFSNNMDAVKFFAELPTPPETEAIMRAVEDLTDLGLLDENEKLTPLGRTISEFQLEPKLAKSLVNAVIFKCVTPIVDIVTLFSAETELFSGALRDKQNILKYKKDFSDTSDHLSLMRLFEKWLEYVEENDAKMANVFINANNLNQDKLLTIQKLRTIHFGYLSNGLKDVLKISDDLSDSDELVKGVLLSGIGTVLKHRSWDIVKGRIKKANVLLTRHSHKATITADSVNYRRTNFPSDYLLYINEVVSNLRGTTLVRESSLISPLALLLFKSGTILLEPLKDRPNMVSVTLDGTKIGFSCAAEDGKIIKETKEALDSIKQYYIYQLTEGGKCDYNLENSWREILHKLDFILLSNSI